MWPNAIAIAAPAMVMQQETMLGDYKMIQLMTINGSDRKQVGKTK